MRQKIRNELELSPGINPMCGYDWIQEHQHDLDGWHPTIELISEHSRYKLSGTSKQVNEAIKEYTKGAN